jgi:nickel/cobalt exporter
MISESLLITSSAASLGFFHTIMGPDHYLPFVAMARTNGWSGYKTAGYVTLCGISHVLGTLLIGLIALVVGFAFFKVESIQMVRGNFAGWFLLFFGAIYFVWGMNWALQKTKIKKFKVESGVFEKKNLSIKQNSNLNRTAPFALFLFFILGPCEPLLPLLALGADDSQFFTSFLVISAFCLTTVLTMLLCVMIFYYGISRFSFFLKMENYMHATTGLVIFVCGFGIQFLGT